MKVGEAERGEKGFVSLERNVKGERRDAKRGLGLGIFFFFLVFKIK